MLLRNSYRSFVLLICSFFIASCEDYVPIGDLKITWGVNNIKIGEVSDDDDDRMYEAHVYGELESELDSYSEGYKYKINVEFERSYDDINTSSDSSGVYINNKYVVNAKYTLVDIKTDETITSFTVSNYTTGIISSNAAFADQSIKYGYFATLDENIKRAIFKLRSKFRR